MADLKPQSATLDLFPITFGEVSVWASEERRVTSIAPFEGKQDEVSTRLTEAVGAGFPLVNRRIEMPKGTLLWVGQGRALLVGTVIPDLTGIAACTDQTGAEAVVRVEGHDVEAVMARLVPLDLRRGAFGNGTTARSMVGHMTASISRISDTTFEVRVMRSMAQRLLHDFSRAAAGVAGRKGR